MRIVLVRYSSGSSEAGHEYHPHPDRFYRSSTQFSVFFSIRFNRFLIGEPRWHKQKSK